MINKGTTSSAEAVVEVLHSAQGDLFPFRQFFDVLRGSIDHMAGAIVSSLPRGGLQLVQPPRLPESLVRGYGREFHALDKLSWTVMERGRPVRAMDCWPPGQFEASRFYNEFLAPAGLQYAVAAPLRAPIIEGYAGALLLLRSAQQGPFSDEAMESLGQIAAELDAALKAQRTQRGCEPCDLHPMGEAGLHRAESQQFAFDASGNALYGEAALKQLDDPLRRQIIETAQRRLAHVNGNPEASERVSLPDSHGDLWNFRVAVYSRYPALSEGPVAFLCIQPDCGEWNQLRPSDFQAAGELSRLIPALRFMHDNFARGPTLHEISRAVHLSPFHFHRRFTELLGITPKHFLLDCQIEMAKRLLLEGSKNLADVASACGFAHQSHFTSRFKQATGLTPTRWRRMALTTQPAA